MTGQLLQAKSGVISWARWFSIGDSELVASVGPSRLWGVPLGRRGCWVATAVAHLQCSVARRTRGAMGSGACFIGENKTSQRMQSRFRAGDRVFGLCSSKGCPKAQSVFNRGVDASRVGTTSVGPMTRPLKFPTWSFGRKPGLAEQNTVASSFPGKPLDNGLLPSSVLPFSFRASRTPVPTVEFVFGAEPPQANPDGGDTPKSDQNRLETLQCWFLWGGALTLKKAGVFQD